MSLSVVFSGDDPSGNTPSGDVDSDSDANGAYKSVSSRSKSGMISGSLNTFSMASLGCRVVLF
jgi:hypothetical protein